MGRGDGAMSLVGRIREWVAGLFAEDGATDDVDEGYLKGARFLYIQTSPDDYPDRFRCNLCGKLFDSMDECVDHVSGHDGQGNASVDPFTVSTGASGRSGEGAGVYQTEPPRGRTRPEYLKDAEEGEVMGR